MENLSCGESPFGSLKTVRLQGVEAAMIIQRLCKQHLKYIRTVIGEAVISSVSRSGHLQGRN